MKSLWQRFRYFCGWLDAERAEDAPPPITPLKREWWTGDRRVPLLVRINFLLFATLAIAAVPVLGTLFFNAFFPERQFAFSIPATGGIILGFCALVGWHNLESADWRKKSPHWIHSELNSLEAIDHLAVPAALISTGALALIVPFITAPVVNCVAYLFVTVGFAGTGWLLCRGVYGMWQQRPWRKQDAQELS